jgi:hypothetical protein
VHAQFNLLKSGGDEVVLSPVSGLDVAKVAQSDAKARL